MVEQTERLLLGIAGPTSAGKTTLIEALKGRFTPGEIAVISVDWYDLERRGDAKIKKAIAHGQYTGELFNWESPSVFDFEQYVHDLQRLKEGKPIVIPS